MTISFEKLPPFPQNVKSINDSETKLWLDTATKAINSLQDVFILISRFQDEGMQAKIVSGLFHGRSLTNTDGYFNIENSSGSDGNITIGISENLPTTNLITTTAVGAFYGVMPLYYNVTLVGVTDAATEDTLHSYDFAANTFFDLNDKAVIEMAGEINNAGGFDTYFRFYVGGTKCFDTGNFAPSTVQKWSMKAILTRISETQLKVICNFFSSESLAAESCSITDVTVAFDGAINIHTTGIGFGLANIIEHWLTTINYEKSKND